MKTLTGAELPAIHTPPPGPKSRALAQRLRRVESSNITYIADDWPIVWRAAKGAVVEDVDDNRYLDFTSAFGVAFIGHNHPRVIKAARRQTELLTHGMGDVHPPVGKVELAERLAEIAPGELSHTILSSDGSDAVESALKTALIYTGKPGVIAFDGAYHGLGYGALAATHRALFREPFEPQLGIPVAHMPFPHAHTPYADQSVLTLIEERLRAHAPSLPPVGAVLIEPIQGRGGVRVFSPAFLRELRELCDTHAVCLIADEMLTGCGRTGAWWGMDASGVVPDILCIGKALGGGFPISACIARPDIMAAWGASRGEAIHTSTFLGNPLGCAMALAALEIIEQEHLLDRARELGAQLLTAFHKLKASHSLIRDVRGRGLLLGIELAEPRGADIMRAALIKGLIILPCGADNDVISITPPATITDEQLQWGVDTLAECMEAVQ